MSLGTEAFAYGRQIEGIWAKGQFMHKLPGKRIIHIRKRPYWGAFKNLTENILQTYNDIEETRIFLWIRAKRM
jgi:hypothetical protein